MDQSKSSNQSQPAASIAIPTRTLGVEFVVGLFTLFGVACAAWLAIGLGDLKLTSGDTYEVIAEFDNISGLERGASVEIAGVPIGSVNDIHLKDSMALVTLRINNGIKLRDDDIAAIRTKGIIGDRYVKISRGASETYLDSGAKLVETESVVDIEDIIGKLVHSLSGEKDSGSKNGGNESKEG
jgi:phospholipid/cholesterol/gamma-HCH transport system substrate-binding protein